MEKIIKPLKEGITASEIYSGGLSNYCSWERLKPYLESAIGIKEDEEIIGVIADDDGITIRIKTK